MGQCLTNPLERKQIRLFFGGITIFVSQFGGNIIHVSGKVFHLVEREGFDDYVVSGDYRHGVAHRAQLLEQ